MNEVKKAAQSQNNWLRPGPAMSYEDWEALGRMGKAYSASDIAFDGNAREHTEENLADRADIERDNHAHVLIGWNHPLNNPKRDRGTTEFESAGALWNYYLRTLTTGDSKALNLLNEFVRTGHKLVDQASSLMTDRSAGNYTTRDIKTEILDTTKLSTDQAADMAEELESLADRNITMDNRNFTIVANTQREATLIRQMVDYALELSPPLSQVTKSVDNDRGPVMLTLDNMPSAEDLNSKLGSIRPPVFDPNRREDGRKTFALISSQGLEDGLIKALGKVNKEVNVFPGFNRDLQSKLIENNDPHFRLKPEIEDKGLKGFRFIVDANEQIIDQADGVLIAWNGVPEDASLMAAAHAARRGKLIGVVNEKGETLKLAETSRLAVETHLSRVEFARSRNANTFDVLASSPEGRLALSQIKKINRSTIEALSKTGLDVNTIVHMASDDQGKSALFKDIGISGEAIRALADEKNIANARESTARILQHCKDHNVAIISPEHYPDEMRKQENTPPVLFVQAQDPEAFKDIKSAVALIGDSNLLPETARKTSDLITSLDRPDVTLVLMEGQGTPQFVPEQSPSVLFLSSGHGAFSKGEALDWKPEGAQIVANGKFGSYSISRDVEDGSIVLAVEKDGSKSELGRRHTGALVEQGKSEAQAKSIIVNGFKDQSQDHQKKLLNEPVLTHRDAVVESGGFVVSALPPVETGSVYVVATGQREGEPSFKTDSRVSQAAELSSDMSKSVILTQFNTKSPIVKNVPKAVLSGKSVIAISPDRSVRNTDDVLGNVMMISKSAAETVRRFGYTDDRGLKLEKSLGKNPVAINSGPNMEILANHVADQVNGRGKSKSQPTKSVSKEKSGADMER